MNVRNLSIKRKLTLITTVTTSVALLLASVGFMVYDLVAFRRLMRRDLVTQAQIIGDNCRAAVSFEDAQSAAETLSALRVKREILAAAIFLPDGRRFARFVRDAGGEVPSAPGPYGARFEGGRLHVVHPVVHGGETLGALYLQSDMRQWYERLRGYLGIMGLVMLGSAAVAFLVSSRLQEVIARPILALGSTMGSVTTDRNYSLRVAKTTRDEIGDLIDGFNAMLAEIQLRDVTLQEVNADLDARRRELEIEVLERRRAERELKALNETLEERVAERSAAAEQRARDLRESEERYALAVQGANDGIWDWKLTTGEVYFSPRWKAMLGFREDEVGSRPEEWLERVHPEDRERVEGEIAAHLEGRAPFFQCEHQVRHRDGSYAWVLARGLAFRDAGGTPLRMAGSQTDMAAGRVADLLTGLPNRVLFMDRLRRALDRAKRDPGRRVGVLFVDLDRFKVVNDSLGHVVGDDLLVAIGRRLEGCLRSVDSVGRFSPRHTVARLGGDEFTILLDEIRDAVDAARVADRVTRALSEPFDVSGRQLFVTASVGIAVSRTDQDTPEQLIHDADTAMYRAKTLGKARYEVFDTEMRQQTLERLQVETDLRRAVEQQEFTVHYQPITSVPTGRTIGFEALVRWRHPSLGLIPPAEFIPLAEENGLIIPLGRWTLHEACRQMSEWNERYRSAPPLSVSVNLSSRQFMQRDLVDQIRQVLSDERFDPGRLKLEITESMIMEDPDSAIAMLEQLRALDIQASIDDFGTGYSSLSYLHRFPLDTLKVDRSFVTTISARNGPSEIMRTIVTLAHNLGLDVVAEGVETADQLAGLRALGCEYAQGYLISRPLAGEAASRFIADQAARSSC
jgi:diguanylate cyclase (GGDEF)-like protein/PAS domain S-box-containing protein